jgi:hypothetical protein
MRLGAMLIEAIPTPTSQARRYTPHIDKLTINLQSKSKQIQVIHGSWEQVRGFDLAGEK